MSSNHMHAMKKDRGIELLDRVEGVDPPPFLFTRIEARINALTAERPSRAWVASMVTAVLLILFVNTFALVQGNAGGEEVHTERIANSMGLKASNQLYHE